MGTYEYNISEVFDKYEKIFEASPDDLAGKENQKEYLVFVHAVLLASEVAIRTLKENTDDQKNADEVIENLLATVRQEADKVMRMTS